MPKATVKELLEEKAKLDNLIRSLIDEKEKELEELKQQLGIAPHKRRGGRPKGSRNKAKPPE